MTDILTKRAAPVLAQFASSNVLVAFDYDGTLAPIVARPAEAHMRARTRRLLAAVAERYPCVVISGRSRDDVSRRVDAVPIWHVAGNHGVEPWGQQPGFATQVQTWVQHLERRLRGCQGVQVEDKRYSLAVHYRRARHPRQALAAILRAVRQLRGYRLIGGDRTVNLVPRGAPHKGVALERARRLLVCDTAIYVGDDDTDEDAFRAARADRLLAVRIGRSARTRARYWLKDQADIDRFLQALLALRPLRHRLPTAHAS
jgi:trehalose 6-phosphate phosphatase